MVVKTWYLAKIQVKLHVCFDEEDDVYKYLEGKGYDMDGPVVTVSLIDLQGMIDTFTDPRNEINKHFFQCALKEAQENKLDTVVFLQHVFP